MKRNFVIIAMVLISAASCVTAPTLADFPDPLSEPQVFEAQDIKLTVNVLTVGELEERHGEFAELCHSYPQLVGKKEIVILQVEIEASERAYNLAPYDVTLEGPSEAHGETADTYLSRWNSYRYKNIPVEKATGFVEDFFFPVSVQISPGVTEIGYIGFFISNYEQGFYDLEIPLETEEGVGIAEFFLDLSEHQEEEKPFLLF